jgi:hypothetical protein
MRKVSTPESVKNEEISALAVFETALAVAVSAIVAYYTSSLKHIAIGAAIAPFLLLRTDESTNKIISISRPVINFFNQVFEALDYAPRYLQRPSARLILLRMIARCPPP